MQILQEVIKAAPKDQVFTIVGHADAKTGSPEYNQKLSERRAKVFTITSLSRVLTPTSSLGRV